MAWISSEVNCTVSIASVALATPPPHMTLMKSAPNLSSSRVAFKTSGTPSHVRPKLNEWPPQHPVERTDGPKSPWPPVCESALPLEGARITSILDGMTCWSLPLEKAGADKQSFFDGVCKSFRGSSSITNRCETSSYGLCPISESKNRATPETTKLR